MFFFKNVKLLLFIEMEGCKWQKIKIKMNYTNKKRGEV